LRGPGRADGAGSLGGVVRLRAEAAQAAEELRREAVRSRSAGREVSRVTRAATALIPPGAVAAFFRGSTRLSLPYRANGRARFFCATRDTIGIAWLTTRRTTTRR